MQSPAVTTNSPSSATTATVREHSCLFTHDLRRKQKRWQDGRLKYHTFNGRVMVYDERGNFVGDTHWREDYDLADGDDLELERGGIMVQVGECVGSRDQDLSELIDKRAQEKAQRQAAAATRRSLTAPVTPLHTVKALPTPQKHLHNVIGSPSGHHGRAVLPTESPFEERQRRQDVPQRDDARPAKRQRREISPPSKSGYAQNLFGATLTLSGRPLSQALPRHRPASLSRAREETASNMASHSGYSDTTAGITRIPTTPNNFNSHRSLGQPLNASDAQAPSEASARRRSSTSPEQLSDANLNLLDEMEVTPTAGNQGSKYIVAKDKRTLNRHSVLRSLSTNQNLAKPKQADQVLEQAEPNADGDGGASRLKVRKKSQNKKRPDTSDGFNQRHKPHHPNTIDLTEDSADILRNKPINDEPRTELKIKPRKKRGLLISERPAARSSSPNPRSSETKPSAYNMRLSSPPRLVNVPIVKPVEGGVSPDALNNRTAVSKKTPELLSQLNRDDGNDNGNHHDHHKPLRINKARHSVEGTEINGMRGPDQSRPNSWNGIELCSDIQQSDAQMLEECTVETERYLRPRKQPFTGKTNFSRTATEEYERPNLARQEGHAAEDEMPAPRLAKLGRKSIKSREVIGLIFDDELDPVVGAKRNIHTLETTAFDLRPDPDIGQQLDETNNTIGKGPMPTEARLGAEPQSRSKGLLPAIGSARLQRENSGESKPPVRETSRAVQAEVLPTVATTAAKQSIPSIANLATRGKKAAKPADAAGQTPVCPLPAESMGVSSLPQSTKNIKAPGNPGKESARPMPGFTRANGGPWSREAHDLFEFKRPP
ncbi:hypothetical protein F4802DRAFT_286755 [Xylaria palmicola]|nr:hypothetical protein F4802DRAFT_286755 [Xylaria palmicola]